MKSLIFTAILSLFGVPALVYLGSLLQLDVVDPESAFTIMKGISGLGVTGFAAFVSYKLVSVATLLYNQMQQDRRHYEDRERELHKQYREDTKTMSDKAQTIIDKYREDLIKNQAYHNSFILELSEKHQAQMAVLTNQFITEIKSIYHDLKSK
jgi:hypothetical protein